LGRPGQSQYRLRATIHPHESSSSPLDGWRFCLGFTLEEEKRYLVAFTNRRGEADFAAIPASAECNMELRTQGLDENLEEVEKARKFAAKTRHRTGARSDTLNEVFIRLSFARADEPTTSRRVRRPSTEFSVLKETDAEPIALAASTESADDLPPEPPLFLQSQDKRIIIWLSAVSDRQSRLCIETEDKTLARAMVHWEFRQLTGTVAFQPEEGIWRGYTSFPLSLQEARATALKFTIEPEA